MMKTMVVLAILSLSPAAHAYCTKGSDGNWYTNETAAETFINVDPSKGPMDFRLRPGSCAINRGMVIPGVTDQPDAAGRTRDSMPDIGAYEYAAAGPKKPQGLEIQPGR